MSRLIVSLVFPYFLAISNCQPLQSNSANTVADDLISQMSSYIRNNGLDSQDLPELSWGQLIVSFNGISGKVNDLSTIHRIGDADLKQSTTDAGTSYSLSLDFEFKTLNIHYDWFLQAYYHLAGTVDLGFDDNQFELTSTILKNGNVCKVTELNVAAKKFSGLKLNLTPAKYNPFWVQKSIEIIYNWYFSGSGVANLNTNMEIIMDYFPISAFQSSICSLISKS